MRARRPYVYDRVTAEIHRRAHGAAASLPPAEACEACGRAQYRCTDGRVGDTYDEMDAALGIVNEGAPS